jgi:serine/threonine-protein kinase
VIHRDVAPANIIITPDGTAKLTDFGLARTVSDPHLTTTGVAVGSAWYMSPEQVKALDELDERTDIYAMGAVLHEMLTGKKLFEADGSFAVMCAQVETVPQPPSASNPEVPVALDTVVAKALAKDPAARFQSAREFRSAMDAAVKSQLAAAPVRSLPAPKSAPPVPLMARLRPSRTTILFTLVPGAVAAVVCAVLLWPKPARVAAKAHVTAQAHVASPAVVSYTAPTPAPAPVIEPPTPAAVVTAPPAPLSTIPAVRPVRKAAAKPAPNLAIRVSGGTVVSAPPISTPASTPTSTPKSTAPRIVAVSAPEAPAAKPETKPETTAVPEVPPTPAVAAAKTPEEPAAAPPTSEEAKPQKGGNRLVRALGKINPFRKNGKPEDTSKPATKKDN